MLQRVSFEFTPEDLADVSVRHGGGKPLVRDMRRRSVLGVGGTTWLVAMLGMVLVSGLRDGRSLAALAVAATLIGGLAAWVQAQQFESRLRARLLRVINGEPSTAQVMRCDVELRPDGLRLQQQNFEMFYRWTDVVSIDDLDAGIELRFLAGYVMVRARAFATADDRASFLTLARSLAQSARATA